MFLPPPSSPNAPYLRRNMISVNPRLFFPFLFLWNVSFLKRKLDHLRFSYSDSHMDSKFKLILFYLWRNIKIKFIHFTFNKRYFLGIVPKFYNRYSWKSNYFYNCEIHSMHSVFHLFIFSYQKSSQVPYFLPTKI